ncbi:DUF6528 family protein [Pendulispora albinea]|uniref:DUF6528 family protein n=1 Tax=Pendulispora albinea TaxID=2741071 RepID=A0ABZ2M193_9BACT
MKYHLLLTTLALTTLTGLSGCASDANDGARDPSSEGEITAQELTSIDQSAAPGDDAESDADDPSVVSNDDDGANETNLPRIEAAADGTETEDVPGEDADDAPASAALPIEEPSPSSVLLSDQIAATPYIGITEQHGDRIMVFPAGEFTWTNRTPSWSWGPNNAKTGTGKNAKLQIPKNLWGKFGNPSDIKFKKNGTLLLAASGGAVAIVRTKDRKLTFVAYPGGNPHAIETLPGKQIVTASSKGYLCVFSTAKSTDKTCEKTNFPLAHGLVWDGARKRLWVLGGTQLGSYSLNGSKLVLDKAYKVPGNGHDLSPDGPDTLLFSSTHNVYSFNRTTHTYRVLPNISPRNYVKGVDRHPVTKELLIARDHDLKDKVYGDDHVDHATPAGAHDTYVRKGAQIYKARWWVGR